MVAEASSSENEEEDSESDEDSSDEELEKKAKVVAPKAKIVAKNKVRVLFCACISLGLCCAFCVDDFYSSFCNLVPRGM